jgi:SAM-dependent methyltransferase
MLPNYCDVTELAGDRVTQAQVERLCHRYYWAGNYCTDKDILEVACGTGAGLGYLAKQARSISAGDYTSEILSIAQAHYGNRIELRQFDAQNIPYADRSMNVIILFEAIYYIPSVQTFIHECRRILKPGGKVLIATANKDLYDFNPSPYSYKYYGVVELNELFTSQGFTVECFGSTPIEKLAWRQRILRPIKKLAVSLGLIPKTMSGKKFFKKLVFGKLVEMPAEITEGMIPYREPIKLPVTEPDRKHQVIYCAATLT